MADISNKKKKKMTQSLVDAANMGEDFGGVDRSIEKVFGGGKLQEQMNMRPKPSTKAEDAAAIRNADLMDPNSVASVRRRMPDRAAEVMAKEKELEAQQSRPSWADSDMSSIAQQMSTDQSRKQQDDEVKKEMLMRMLKQKRGY